MLKMNACVACTLQELTEEGLPFLILFYNPSQGDEIKRRFKDACTRELQNERCAPPGCTHCHRVLIVLDVLAAGCWCSSRVHALSSHACLLVHESRMHRSCSCVPCRSHQLPDCGRSPLRAPAEPPRQERE